MGFLDHVFSHAKDHRDAESMCKPCLVVDATSWAGFTVSEVCNQKSGSANFRDDFVIDLVVVLLLINPHRLVARILNPRCDTVRINV